MSLETKLNECRMAVSYIVKDAKKVNGQYYPITYNDVVSKCKPELISRKIGMWFSVVSTTIRAKNKVGQNKDGSIYEFNDGYFTDMEVACTVVNIEDPKDRDTFSVFVTSYDSLDKGAAKAFTTARKQAYISLFQLETYEDGEEPKEAPAPVPPVMFTTIGVAEVETLRGLASKIGVDEEVIAKAADAEFTKIEQIPVGKYAEILERLEKRLKQIESAKTKNKDKNEKGA